MTNSVNQVIDTLLRSHLTHVELEREYDSCTSVHSPKEGSDTVFWRSGKSSIPQDHFPIKCPPFNPERSSKKLSIWAITRVHKLLHVVARNELMEYRCPGKMLIVASHAHHLGLVVHFVGWEANHDGFATKEERTDFLSLG